MRNFIVNVNGTTYQISVEEIDGTAAQKAAPAPAAAPAAAPAPAAKPSAGGNAVSSPMPGNILAVNYKAGDRVKSGDTVMILEAMKMENEIVAPEDGTVASVNVGVGDSVEAGDTLATLD